VPEQPTEEEIFVQLASPPVETVQETRVETQMEQLAQELADEIISQLTTETTEGQEITVDLAQHRIEEALATMVQTQEEVLPEESIAEITERVPSPEAAGHQEIIVELAAPEVQEKQETKVEIVEEQHAAVTVEENIEELMPETTFGEDVTVELTQPQMEAMKEVNVDIVEERHSEEEEEEMFLEAPEIPLPGEEVVVPLETAGVRDKEEALTTMQTLITEPEVAEEANAEFHEETPQPEQVVVDLETATAEAPKPSLVETQEEVVLPQLTEELLIELVQEEITKETNVVVDLGQADKEAPKPSLVGTQEEHLDVQTTKEDVEGYVEEFTVPEEITVDLKVPEKEERPDTHVELASEAVQPEMVSEEYVNSLKEVYMIPSLVRPEYEPSVVERYRFETRVRPQDVSAETTQQVEAQSQMSANVQITTEVETVASQMAKDIVRAVQEVTQEQEEVTETVTEQIEVISSLMAPVFEMPLSDITASDGERAVFQCKVAGTPKPEVTWYIDNVEIKPTKDFTVTYEHGVCTLIIADVLPEDEGEYSVKAVNDAGTCVTTAYLTVLPPSRSESEAEPESPVQPIESPLAATSPKVIEEQRQKVEVEINIEKTKKISRVEVPFPVVPEAPRFISVLQPKEIHEGMPVTLDCQIVSNPEAQVSWYKDGKKLVSTKHLTIGYQLGVCTLTIDKATVEDEAEYMVEARNELGIESCVAQLLVEKLVSAVEQLMLEEFYEVEIDMHFKWRSSLQATEDRARHEMLA